MQTPRQEEARKKATVARSANGNHKSRNATGIITADESFTLAAFIERLGTTRTHVIEMRRRGLVARRDGGKNVRILGSDYLAYLATLPVAELDPKDDEQPKG